MNGKKRTISIVALSFTALFWGAGFVITHTLLNNGLKGGAAFINGVRFVTAALLYAIVFGRKISFNKTSLLYGAVGGAALFGGFLFQVLAQNYTTPANSGFFTASYIVFMPLFGLLVNKKRPTPYVILCIALAFGGMFLLNFGNTGGDSFKLDVTSTIGNLLALAGALCFAFQMSWTGKALEKVDSKSMVFFQVVTAAVLFAAYFLIFEVSKIDFAAVNWGICAPCLAFVALLGTAFAYVAQTMAQKHISPTETSLILSCESVFGAVFSIAFGIDKFSVWILLGGLLVMSAVVLNELLPTIRDKKRKKQ